MVQFFCSAGCALRALFLLILLRTSSIMQRLKDCTRDGKRAFLATIVAGGAGGDGHGTITRRSFKDGYNKN